MSISFKIKLSLLNIFIRARFIFFIFYKNLLELVLADDNTENRKKYKNSEKTQKIHNLVNNADVSKKLQRQQIFV